MAANIDQSTGTAAIAYTGSTPWHKLGRRMTEAEQTDITLAMQASRTDYEVRKIALEYAAPSGSMTPVPDAAGIIRTDTGRYLATVGSDYQPVQNRQAFSIVEDLVSRHGCQIAIAGALDDGRQAWILIRMPGATISPVDGDAVNGYTLVRTAHDGLSAVRAVLTPIRVLCQNTLALAERTNHTTAVSIRHTVTAEKRIDDAARVMDRLMDALQATGETFKSLAAKQLNARDLATFIETLIPTPKDTRPEDLSPTLRRRREAIADLIFNGRGNQPYADARAGVASAWAAYNGVVEYFDHVRACEAKSSSASMSAYTSALFGANAQTKVQAMRYLIAA